MGASTEVVDRPGDVRPPFAGDEKGGRPAAFADGRGKEGPEAVRAPFGKAEEGIAQEKSEDLASGRAERVEIAGEIAGEIQPSGETQATAFPMEQEVEKRPGGAVQDEVGRSVADGEGRALGTPSDDEPPPAGQEALEGEAAAGERGRESAEFGILLPESVEKGGKTRARPGVPPGHGRVPRWTATSPAWRSWWTTSANPAERIIPASVSWSGWRRIDSAR